MICALSLAFSIFTMLIVGASFLHTYFQLRKIRDEEQ